MNDLKKHNYNFITILSKKELLLLLTPTTMFFSLGVLSIFYGAFTMGMILAVLSMVVLFAFYTYLCNSRTRKVMRITIVDSIPRFIMEYWRKEDWLKIPRHYFWIYNNKQVPVLLNINGSVSPFDPFLGKPLPVITSGDLKRSLNQDSVAAMFWAKARQLYDTIQVGLYVLLAGGGLLAIIVLSGSQGTAYVEPTGVGIPIAPTIPSP